MTSRTLVANCGSRLSLKLLSRCGARPWARQIFCTVLIARPHDIGHRPAGPVRGFTRRRAQRALDVGPVVGDAQNIITGSIRHLRDLECRKCPTDKLKRRHSFMSSSILLRLVSWRKASHRHDKLSSSEIAKHLKLPIVGIASITAAMARRIACIGKKRMGDFVSYREAHPLPWLCRIELKNTQPLLIRDRPGVDHVAIRLRWYVQQFGNGKGIEWRAFPTGVVCAQGEFPCFPLNQRHRIVFARRERMTTDWSTASLWRIGPTLSPNFLDCLAIIPIRRWRRNAAWEFAEDALRSMDLPEGSRDCWGRSR